MPKIEREKTIPVPRRVTSCYHNLLRIILLTIRILASGVLIFSGTYMYGSIRLICPNTTGVRIAIHDATIVRIQIIVDLWMFSVFVVVLFDYKNTIVFFFPSASRLLLHRLVYGLQCWNAVTDWTTRQDERFLEVQRSQGTYHITGHT